MSIQTNALALHEILLSISDSLNKAQNQLRNMPAFDEYGRPNTIYQLPYLDFNLEVISEFSAPAKTTTTPQGRAAQLAQVSTGNFLKFVPFAATDYSKLSNNKITSVISGRFIAVLPNDGLQQVYMFCQAKLLKESTTSVTYQVIVKLKNATSDALDGQRVEVNFDRQNSDSINGAAVADPVFTSQKDGFTGVAGTPGEFVTTVVLDAADYQAGKTFIFVANSGTVFSSVGISRPN
jgi:hypothetical protein